MSDDDLAASYARQAADGQVQYRIRSWINALESVQTNIEADIRERCFSPLEAPDAIAAARKLIDVLAALSKLRAVASYRGYSVDSTDEPPTGGGS